MVEIVALSAKQHHDAGWMAPESYAFAGKQPIALIVAKEIPQIIANLPTGFVKTTQGDDGHAWHMAAICGIQSDKNLCVNAEGRWLAGHIPACFRAHPFRLIMDASENRKVIGFDKSSGLWLDEVNDFGQAFFNQKDQPTERLQEVVDFLYDYDHNRAVTEKAVTAIDDAGLLEPWTLPREDGEKTIIHPGVYRINEQALRAASGETLSQLTQTGAMTLVYAQMLSQHRLPNLSKLNHLHQNTVTKDPDVDLESFFGDDDDTFKFD